MSEVIAEVVVHNRAVMVRRRVVAELVFHCRSIVNVIRWIGKDHIGNVAFHKLLHVVKHRGIAAEELMLA